MWQCYVDGGSGHQQTVTGANSYSKNIGGMEIVVQY